MQNSTTDREKPAQQFSTFPQFSKLALTDRAKYEARVKGLPPLSELGFPTLMLWWNSLNACAVSELNGNLIVSYWLPGMDTFSGLSLIGDNDVEQSMCEIFDWQRDNGEKPRLTHVPEFVVQHIQHPDMYICEGEREFDEYIFEVANFYPLADKDSFRRKRVDAFKKIAGKTNIDVRSLDLNDPENVRLLRSKMRYWQKTGHINDTVTMEVDAIEVALQHAEVLGIQNMCIFVDEQLQGFCTYYKPHDARYVVVTNGRMNSELPWTIDFAMYAFGQRMAREGVQFINMEGDLGSQFMRMFKLSLGPVGFFRKYTIVPAS